MEAMVPENEAETIALFRMVQKLLGWELLYLQSHAFPDAVVRNPQGKLLRAEFEHKARNFLAHAHNPANCDLIICWENNWADCPLPVLALAEYLSVAPLPADKRGRDRSWERQTRLEGHQVSYRGIPPELNERIKRIAQNARVTTGEMAGFLLEHAVRECRAGHLVLEQTPAGLRCSRREDEKNVAPQTDKTVREN